MSLSDIKALLESPDFREHWRFVATPVDTLLTNHLIETAHGAKGGEQAQAEVGAVKELAHLIKIFRGIKQTAVEPTARTPMRGLNRNLRKDPTNQESNKQ